jgi:hypothetical protein
MINFHAQEVMENGMQVGELSITFANFRRLEGNASRNKGLQH